MDQGKKKLKFYLHASKIIFAEDLADRNDVYQLGRAPCKVDHSSCNDI